MGHAGATSLLPALSVRGPCGSFCETFARILSPQIEAKLKVEGRVSC